MNSSGSEIEASGAKSDGNHAILRDARLEVTETEILKAIRSLRSGKDRGRVLLVVDGLDFLLAATNASAAAIDDMIGELREVGRHKSSLCTGCVVYTTDHNGIARLRNYRYGLRRFPIHPISYHAARNCPRRLYHFNGAPGEAGDGAENAGHWHGERRQWSVKNISRYFVGG